MIPWLPLEPVFPPLESALTEADGPNGLLAAGGDLSPRRLLAAYARGIFPWFSQGEPILWWSPDPRMVLFPDRLTIRSSFAKVLRNRPYEVRVDTAFSDVMAGCASPRGGQSGTWIVPEMVEAYCAWHELGQVHSFETWIDGELAGGLYGVSLGRMFFGESMFAHRTDASKIALAALVCFCREHGVPMIDCQQRTGHLASLGGREVSRFEFEQRLSHGRGAPAITDWTYHVSMWRHLDRGAGDAPDGLEGGP